MTAHHSHKQIVEKQFGPMAEAYLSSATHAAGEDLLRLQDLLRDRSEAEVLDLGCGGGHVSYTVAPLVRRVTAYDLSVDMLQVVTRAAGERGLSNIAVQQGLAERLPFADASFDVVLSRYSAHHWHDVGAAVREVRRTLKPGGMFVLIDVASPGHWALDIHLQTVEMLRDTSHVRDYAPGEWLHFVEEAGLCVQALHSFKLHLEFDPWIARMTTPEHFVRAIQEVQKVASDEVRAHFAIEADGSFTVGCLLLTAGKA